MTGGYEETYRHAMADPAGFWAAAAEDLHWDRRWDRVFDDSRPPYYRWFTGGTLNTCYNALDLHVDRGRGKQRALVYDSPVTDTIRVFTYAVWPPPGRTPLARRKTTSRSRTYSLPAGQTRRRKPPSAASSKLRERKNLP